jgi:hypothetical protein
MVRQELRKAIEQPAQQLHVTLEQGLADRLLDAVDSVLPIAVMSPQSIV